MLYYQLSRQAHTYTLLFRSLIIAKSLKNTPTNDLLYGYKAGR